MADISAFWRIVLAVLPSVVTLGAVIVAFLAYRHGRKAQQFANTQKFLFDNYWNRPMGALKEVVDPETKLPIRTLRHARDIFRFTSGLSRGDLNHKELLRFWNQSIIAGTPENAVAWEMSAALEHMGLAAFHNALSLEFCLCNSSATIAADWLRIAWYVRAIRTDDMSPCAEWRESALGADEKNYYLRRHGEWLALTAALWYRKMFANDPYAAVDALIEAYGGEEAVRRTRRRLEKSH